MESKRLIAYCISIQSPAAFNVKIDNAIQRFVLDNVVQPKLQLQQSTISSCWIQGTKNLMDLIENKEIQYALCQKRKAFSFVEVYVEANDIRLGMLERGLIKMNKPTKEQSGIETKAKNEKIGIWRDQKTKLKIVNETVAKREYDKITQPITKRCYVQRVEGLKLFLIDLVSLQQLILYMSQLKIPRMNGLDPRKAFVFTEDYIKDIIGKNIITCKVKGCEIYKGEVSLLGTIFSGDRNLTQELIKAGYAELSKNAEGLIKPSQVYEQYVKLEKQAKLKGYGFFKKKVEKDPIDTSGMSKTNKFKQYEYWIKQERRVSMLKNPTEELAQMFSIYKIEGKQELNSGLLKRLKTLSNVISVLLTGSGEKYTKELTEYFQKNWTLFSQLSGQLIINLQNVEFMKLINVLLRGIATCINEIKDKVIIGQIQKHLKTIFRLSFLGNNIFHAKIFGKEKQIQLENFTFNNYELSGSSMSQISDDQRPDKQHVKKKRLNDSYLKIRISSTILIYQTLKLMPHLIEPTWELIVKPNFFSENFVSYVNSLVFKNEMIGFKIQDKVTDQLKINFGDHSLLSMLIFETNQKVKSNILNCLQLFICFYQGRKIIQTLEYPKYEKQVKQIKSFIQKSFLVFSAYKNLFYTLIFCLAYERISELKVLILRIISSIIDQTVLLKKLPYQFGIYTLIENILFTIVEQQNQSELKLVAINCLSKIVGTEEKHKQFSEIYLSKTGKRSICSKLIRLLTAIRKDGSDISKEIINEINVFFASFANNYFENFIKKENEDSIWLELLKFQDSGWQSFSVIIQNICKRLNNNSNIQQEGEKVEKEQSKEVQAFKQYFLNEYLPKYLQQCEAITNSNSIINLINIYCELKSNIWDNPLYDRPCAFLLFLFSNLSPERIKLQIIRQSFIFPTQNRIQENKNNPHVRIALLKLVGYMSFISKFQTYQIAKPVFQTILKTIQTAKGLNTMIKCSWALSNWCSVGFLHEILTEEDGRVVFQRLVQFSHSDKQKIAYHGIRGLGAFAINMSKNSPLSQQLIRSLKQALIVTTKHKSVKVSWNAMVTLRALMKLDNFNFEGQFGNKFMNVLIMNLSINNFKLQLQTIQTIKCLPNTYTQQYILEIAKGLMKIVLQTNKQQLTEYSFNEYKCVDSLGKQINRYLVKNLQKTSRSTLKNIIENIDLYLLLESIYKHLLTLRIQEQQSSSSLIITKGQQKGDESDKQIFNVKKKIIFDEQQKVSSIEQTGCKKIVIKAGADEDFFNSLKVLSERIQTVIEEDQSIKINFSVVEGFQQLSQMSIKENRAVVKILDL